MGSIRGLGLRTKVSIWDKDSFKGIYKGSKKDL